jgi:hypothetical protein
MTDGTLGGNFLGRQGVASLRVSLPFDGIGRSR